MAHPEPLRTPHTPRIVKDSGILGRRPITAWQRPSEQRHRVVAYSAIHGDITVRSKPGKEKPENPV